MKCDTIARKASTDIGAGFTGEKPTFGGYLAAMVPGVRSIKAYRAARQLFRPVMMNVVQNLKWGLRWGLTMAVGFTVIGVVATIGASFDPTPRNDPSLLSLVGFYFLAGIVGGLLLGLLRPITRYKAGAVVVGTALAAVSLSLLARIYVVTDGWTLVDTILVALYSLVTGPVATLMILEVRARKGKGFSDPPVLGQ